MFAIIKSGTQQFKVSEGDHIKVSLISSPEGSKVSFDDINNAITIGTGLKKPDFDLTVKSFNEYNSEPSKDGYIKPRGT